MTDMSKRRSRSRIHLMNQEFRAYGNHLSADNGAIHLALMIWFIGMDDTNVMECTSLYYKLKGYRTFQSWTFKPQGSRTFQPWRVSSTPFGIPFWL